MALQISVAPAAHGWVVRSEAFDNELMFEAGGRAEAAARSLAARYAKAGRPTQVSIFMRDGALAGSFMHHAGA